MKSILPLFSLALSGIALPFLVSVTSAQETKTHTTYLARTLHAWPTDEPHRFNGGSIWSVNPGDEPAKVTGTFYFTEKAPVSKNWEVPAKGTRVFGFAAVSEVNDIVGVKIESTRWIQPQFTCEVVKNPAPEGQHKPEPRAKKPEGAALISYLATHRLGNKFFLGDACTSGKPVDGPSRPRFEQQYLTIVNPSSEAVKGTVTGYFKNKQVIDIPVVVPAERVLHVEAADIGLGNIESYEHGRLMSMATKFDRPVAVMQSRMLLKNTGGDLKTLPIIESFTWMMEAAE